MTKRVVFAGARGEGAWTSHAYPSQGSSVFDFKRFADQHGILIPFDSVGPVRLIIPNSIVELYDLVSLTVDGVDQIKKHGLSKRCVDYAPAAADLIVMDRIGFDSRVEITYRRTQHQPDEAVLFRASMNGALHYTEDQQRSLNVLSSVARAMSDENGYPNLDATCLVVEAPHIPMGWMCSACVRYNVRSKKHCGHCGHAFCGAKLCGD